jgi:hypothetical protein
VREAATSLTCELFCLNSRNNSARAPVNYDLKKRRSSALVAIRRAYDLLGKKFSETGRYVPSAASAV